VTGERLLEAAGSVAVRSLDDVLLDAPACPICAACAEAEKHFFSWFDNETFAEPAMHARLRASVGFCPAHQRRMLARPQLSPVPAIVAGALAQLAPEPPPRASCPACEPVEQARAHALQRLCRALARADHRARYEARASGACLPHLAATVAAGHDPAAPVLTERLRRDLASAAAFELVAGCDPDAPMRRVLRGGLPGRPSADATTSGDAEREAWRVPACPACLAGGRAERRYLDWRRHEERADAVDLRHEPGLLCATHLHDLAAADEHAAARATGRVRERWVADLDRLLEANPELLTGPDRRSRRRRGAPPPPRLRLASCPACEARDGAERRQLDLVQRLLARPAYARAYESAHGLCLAHVLQATDAAAAPVLRRELRGHLRELDWEIAEAARKQRWDARHERPGPERTAASRLAALLNGRTFLGGPACGAGAP
jgi:hypothetical protein